MESGINKKSNILILTSFISYDGSSQMVNDIIKSLESDYNVDVLTKYPLKRTYAVKIYSVYNIYEKYIHFSFLHVKNKILHLKKAFEKNKINKKDSLPYYFFGLNEQNPRVSSKKILKKIKKEYDFVLVFFWQGFLTSQTLKDINDKINKPFLLVAADMFPMTGGCSYFWDCDRLVKSCGKCPGLDSNEENDITRKNFLFKKSMLKNINSIFLGNSWQINHALKSRLFSEVGKIYPIVNENVFRPRDRKILKEKFNYSDKVVLFFGSLGVHDPRKGFEYLLQALHLLHKSRPDLVKNIVLVVAGNGEKVPDLDSYRIEYTGYLTFDELAEYYAMADVFLSPSIQDAGPMMLNQALMCGTPAVAFDIGTACDILNDKTGYLAKYKDSEDFCTGIITLITKSKIELENVYEECRLQSLQRSSYEAFRNDIITAFDRIKDK